jgi:hypothetical protein
MAAHDSNAWSRSEAVRNARAILAGELGVLEGCIPLASLAHALVPDWTADPDFVVFGSLASEIDHLPFGSVRRQWSADALARADVEIEKLTQAARTEVLAACRNIIGRYDAADSMAPLRGCAV